MSIIIGKIIIGNKTIFLSKEEKENKYFLIDQQPNPSEYDDFTESTSIFLWSDTFIKNELKNKQSILPTFHIVYGPQASGKSTIVNRYKKQGGIEIDISKHGTIINEHNSIFIDVDRILYENPLWKKELNILKSMYEGELLNEETSKLYFKHRKVADIISDNITDLSIKNKLNIFWETTGFNVNWTIGYTSIIRRLSDYRIVLLYPFVEVEELKKRAKDRAIKTGQVYDEKHIEENNKRAQENLKSLILYLDALYIFDNQSLESKDKLLLIAKIERIYEPEKEFDSLKPVVKTNGDYFLITKGEAWNLWIDPIKKPSIISFIENIIEKKYYILEE
jgi:predicted ABC-type ATPase